MLEALGIQKTTRGQRSRCTWWRRRCAARFSIARVSWAIRTSVQVPVARLTSKATRTGTDQDDFGGQASSLPELGKGHHYRRTAGSPEATTHFSIIDKDGMAVSNTYTLEGGYGSHVVIKGTGILLNNEMGDFNKKPGTTNLTGDIGTPANVIAPGKRMLSSMTPAIVVRNGKVVMITGSPGGRTIINTVLNVVLNVTAWNMTGRDAVDAARSDHEWLPDRFNLEEGAASEDVLATLRALGHTVRQAGRQGAANSIWIQPDTGLVFGVNDRRDSTSKASAGK
jgi:gamma-glutamyltranspeptidase/glutathione hydrolase